MKVSMAGRERAVGICASLALLAGCGGGVPGGAPQQSPIQSAPSGDRSGSWMKPDGYTGALLYVSDPGANVVNVLSYPNGKRLGKLTGFDRPRGECVDGDGNVYVTNEGASNVLEYAHGGTTPIDTIPDPGQNPYDCAVNLNEGNLTGHFAILNISTTTGGRGTVTVIGGQAEGTYKLNMFSSVKFLSYTQQQNVGNLFVDGTNSSGGFQMAILGPHRNKFRPVTMPHSIGAPGGIQWDGKYLAVGDQNGPSGTTVVDRFGIRNGNISFVDTVPLSSSVDQFFTDGKTLVGPSSLGATVYFWDYPAGGPPTKTLTFFVAPFGSVVSNP
jgi:hypothetical protein